MSTTFHGGRKTNVPSCHLTTSSQWGCSNKVRNLKLTLSEPEKKSHGAARSPRLMISRRSATIFGLTALLSSKLHLGCSHRMAHEFCSSFRRAVGDAAKDIQHPEPRGGRQGKCAECSGCTLDTVACASWRTWITLPRSRATSSKCTKTVRKKVFRCECQRDRGKLFAVTFQAKMHREPPKTAFVLDMSPILHACQRFGHLELLVRDWVNYEVTSCLGHCIGGLPRCSQDGFNIGECKVGDSTCDRAFGRFSVLRPRAKGTDAGTFG